MLAPGLRHLVHLQLQSAHKEGGAGNGNSFDCLVGCGMIISLSRSVARHRIDAGTLTRLLRCLPRL